MAAANAWLKREESLLLTSTWKAPCPVLEISFTFPLFAENIFRPLLAWFLLKKRLAVWSVQWSGLLQTFLKQISLMVFYPYSTIDTFCSQSELAIDFDVITVRSEILYCFGFPSEALPWITIYGESLSSKASRRQNMWHWAVPIYISC